MGLYVFYSGQRLTILLTDFVVRSKIPDIDKDKDPSESLMDMMKKMYEEGDDEMKRTIAKAWTESREKQAAGNLGL